MNNGDSTMNVTGVSGGLYDPSNSFAKIENVTAVTIKTAVPAGDEITLEFPYAVTRSLPYYPFAMQLIASVVYADDRGTYSSVLVNTTVTFVQNPEPFNALEYLPSLAMLACMALFTSLVLEANPAVKKLVKEAFQEEAAGAEGSSAAGASASASSSSSSSSSSGAAAAGLDAIAASRAAALAGYKKPLVKVLASLDAGATAKAREAKVDAFLQGLAVHMDFPDFEGPLDAFVYSELARQYDVHSVKEAMKKEKVMTALKLATIFS